MNTVQASFKRAYEQQGPYGDYPQLAAYIKAGNTFEEEAELLKSQIVEELKDI